MKPARTQNFCRVFELPNIVPQGFCFHGGLPTTMLMVDWFDPWPTDGPGGELQDSTWDEVVSLLRPFLLEKQYVRPGRRYILITDFGEAMIFQKETP